MSGKMLVETLKGLNCPGSETLDAQGLDWTFENEALSPMLEWFCSHVNQSNILQPAEVEEYKELCQSGNVVLKGRQLDEALSNLDFVEDDSKSEESLKAEVEQLTANLQQHKRQRDRLVKRRKLLNDHQTSLSARLGKLAVVEGRVKHEYKAALAQAHHDDSQMNESLEKLKQTVGDLSHLYDGPASSDSRPAGVAPDPPLGTERSHSPSQPTAPPMFLSQVPVTQYYSAEEAYTTQLTAYTKKQFFQGIGAMAGGEEDSRYEILEVSDPASLLVRGETHEVNMRDCKELARLQQLYVKSESDRICALCDLKKLRGQLTCLEATLASLKSGTFSTDTAKNKERLQKVTGAVAAARQDLRAVSEVEVPRLVLDVKEAKALRVLTGDYNLKLARQHYFTHNQDKVINELVHQRARNEFVTMALEVELRRHRELHHVLTSLYTQLHDHYTHWQARMTVMADPALTPARHKRETIDSRDKSTARLHNMLDENVCESSRQLFLTYTSLLENGERLAQRHHGVTTALAATSNTGQHRVHMLEGQLRACEELVYAGSTTTGGQPLLTPRFIQDTLLEGQLRACEELVYTGSTTTGGQPLLTPRPIQDTLLQLQEMLERLEQEIMNIVKDVDHKKKVLKYDPLLSRERKVFTYFFTNPGKLQHTLEELATRLHAEKHMDKADTR